MNKSDFEALGDKPHGLQALRVRAHFLFVDHGLLRTLWSNFHAIWPGVYRSNQPSPERVARLKELGIKTIISLRGKNLGSWNILEHHACAEAGIHIVNHALGSRRPPSRERILSLIEIFRSSEYPILIHCKSGSDRTGIAAGIYLCAIAKQPVEKAMQQLAGKYFHRQQGKAGILIEVFRDYQKRLEQSPIEFEDWVRTEYDPESLMPYDKEEGA